MNTGFSADKTDKVKKALLESLSHGATVKIAVEAANVSRTYFYDLLNDDAEFRKQVKDSEFAAISTVEDALWLKASNGHPTCIFFYLCNRAPDRWKSIQKDATGNDGGAGLLQALLNQRSEMLRTTMEGQPQPTNENANG